MNLTLKELASLAIFNINQARACLNAVSIHSLHRPFGDTEAAQEAHLWLAQTVELLDLLRKDDSANG